MIERVAEHLCSWHCGSLWLGIMAGVCLLVLAAVWTWPRT